MIRKLLIFSLFFYLIACSVGPDYTEPKNSFFDKWFASEPKNTSEKAIRLDWWKVFADPLLEKYIKEAVTNNKNIQVALANVQQARALRQEASSGFFPQLDGSALSSRTKSAQTTSTSSSNRNQIRNLYETGFDASWEIDIFGGTRRLSQAASARTESAIADYHGVMLATLSEVARNYYEIRGLQKRIAITEKNSKLLKQTLDLIEARLKAGEASKFDLTRARGEYQLTRARLPNLKADLHAAIFNLSILLGEPPESLTKEIKIAKSLPTPSDIVPIGLRSDIIRRRPDIRIAERNLAASIADIGVAQAELFPKFSLTGNVGSEARTFGDLFTAAGSVWSLTSLIQWSIFEGGATQARIDAKKAGSKAALARYEQTVLEALKDVETALTRYGRELETRNRLEEGVKSRRQSVKLAQKLFDAGEEDFLAVIDAERELTASEDDLVISETNSITKLIALYTALGGGWEVFEIHSRIN